MTAALANSAMGVKKSSSTKTKGNEDVIDVVRKAGITAYAASQRNGSAGAGDASDGGSDGVSDGGSYDGYDSDESWESYCRYKRRYEEKRRKKRSRSRSMHGRSRSRSMHGKSRSRSRRELKMAYSPQPREEASQSLGSYVSE